ncbi:hypothetical protein F53441_7095 [Fusarium austroafricanum]|uniref:Uncharacterized protein n=1 Tax=Fusarium austroafricanum TaxID=2364996 RepID=A0A8H4KIA4_9HYPO|nr:hypothetical protein F53441_7095 [Fusarium austroafricanum]
MVFPYQASSPEFCWGYIGSGYDAMLTIEHPTIDSWEATMGERYEGPRESNLIVHALGNDNAIQGKTLGHAIRIASWKPPNGISGHLEGFNETVLALAGPLSGRFYGPVVAFAYKLNHRFEFGVMDDMSTADFGPLVDVFDNSDWNPFIRRVRRYPKKKKTLSALFLPDPFNVDRLSSVSSNGNISDLSIPRIIGIQSPAIEVDIAASLDLKQLCDEHKFCEKEASSIKELCIYGYMFHVLLLGPLLLDLPWIGRNALVTDVHNLGLARYFFPNCRWQDSRSRFLCRGVRLGHKRLTFDKGILRDGIIIFNAFGAMINPLHLLAYDEFMFRQLQTDKSKRQFSKLGFLSFWNDLKSGTVQITDEFKKLKYSSHGVLEPWDDPFEDKAEKVYHIKLGFDDAPSPYDYPANAKPVLSKDENQVFLHVRKLLQDPDFMRLDQRDWLEMIYEADMPAEERTLSSKYWKKSLDKFFKRMKE